MYEGLYMALGHVWLYYWCDEKGQPTDPTVQQYRQLPFLPLLVEACRLFRVVQQHVADPKKRKYYAYACLSLPLRMQCDAEELQVSDVCDFWGASECSAGVTHAEMALLDFVDYEFPQDRTYQLTVTQLEKTFPGLADTLNKLFIIDIIQHGVYPQQLDTCTFLARWLMDPVMNTRADLPSAGLTHKASIAGSCGSEHCFDGYLPASLQARLYVQRLLCLYYKHSQEHSQEEYGLIVKLNLESVDLQWKTHARQALVFKHVKRTLPNINQLFCCTLWGQK